MIFIHHDVFLTLQRVIQESHTVAGDNTYKLPHMGKNKLRREGKLPISITCDPNLIASSREILDSSFVNAVPDIEEPAGPADADMSFEEPGDDAVADMSVEELMAAVADLSVAAADTEFTNI